jgi:hypothetical protein
MIARDRESKSSTSEKLANPISPNKAASLMGGIAFLSFVYW